MIDSSPAQSDVHHGDSYGGEISLSILKTACLDSFDKKREYTYVQPMSSKRVQSTCAPSWVRSSQGLVSSGV